MRQAIETAPKDGTIVILEDDASGTYDVAHWSAEAGRWVGENGEPSKITPTHWHQRPRDQYFPEEDERQPRRLATFSIVVVSLLVMGLMGLYFEVFDSKTILPRPDSHKTDLALRQRAEADHAKVKEGTQGKQAVEAPPPEARQSLMSLSTESGLTNEPAENRRARLGHAEVANSAQSIEQEQQWVTLTLDAIAGRQELPPSTKHDRQALEEERGRSAALASELATAKRGLEARAAQLRQSGDEAAQLRQAEAAKSAQSIEEERKKADALALEAGIARQELTASTDQHRQALEEERGRSAALASELATAQREIENRTAQSQRAVDAATKQKQAASTIAELRQSLQQEQQKTAALMQEAKAAQGITASAQQQRRALVEAQARAAAFASELAGTQREIETQAAQSQKAVDEALQQKRAAEAATAELQQSLLQEQMKTAALIQEAKTTQTMTTAAEQSAVDEQKQAAESTIAELRQSLQQERDGTEAMARDLASVRRTMDGRVAVGRPADSHVVQVTQAVKTAATEPPKAGEAQGNAEAAKLIARASALLGQGNIGAARIVLERAAESGNAQASFMLAETYDPTILSAWGTYGTRGEAAKAREHYAKAHAGGIPEAKGRLDALRQ